MLYFTRQTYQRHVNSLEFDFLFHAKRMRVYIALLTLSSTLVPKKVKIFLQRSARGCLFCRYDLRRKRVPCPATCPLCDLGDKNEWHIFFGCSYFEADWREASLSGLIRHHVEEAGRFKPCFFSLLQSLQEGPQKVFTMMLQCIWKRRNEKV